MTDHPDLDRIALDWLRTSDDEETAAMRAWLLTMIDRQTALLERLRAERQALIQQVDDLTAQLHDQREENANGNNQ